MTKEQMKEQNIEAVKIAKQQLAESLSHFGLEMSGWGKANSYNCIKSLLTYCRKDISDLNCFQAIEK
tara:strand:+ start:362 stop:562 length:201 start_codon:yes stop_codon:yes gene_type:complete